MIATAYGPAQTGVVANNFIWRYWFRPGGEISLGVCRIAIFAALLHSLIQNYYKPSAVAAQLATVSAENYIPKGILKIFGPLALNADVMVLVWWLAYATCIMAIVGLVTRPAMIVATLSTLAVLSLKESFGPFWSHGYNVNACAALAIMFAPAGACLSLDRIVTLGMRWWPFGRESLPTSYLWGVLAAQIAVAFFYLGAFWAKIYYGGLTWAFSDNMRIMLASTWEHPYAALEIPWRIQALMDHSLLWKAAAVLHLVTQALPIVAAFHMRHPVLRLLEGAIFVSGIYGLYLIMAVWDPQWFWLGAVFVDWEWLLTKVRMVPASTSQSAASAIGSVLCWARPALVPKSFAFGYHGANPPPRMRDPWPLYPVTQRIPLSYVGIFLGYYGIVFMFQLGRQHLNYPFSNFDFYAINYAYPPYSEHKHYTFMSGGIRFRTKDCKNIESLPDYQRKAFACNAGTSEYTREIKQSATLYEYYRATSHAAISGALGAIRADAKIRFPGAIPDTSRIDLLVRLWQYPPYPLPVTPRVTLEMLRGVQLPDGRTLSVAGTTAAEHRILVSTHGFSDPEIHLRYYHDAWYGPGAKAALPVPGKWLDARSFKVDSEQMRFPAFTSILVRNGEEEYEFWGPILYN